MRSGCQRFINELIWWKAKRFPQSVRFSLKLLPLKEKIWRKDITFASNSFSCQNLNLSSIKFDPNFWIKLVQKLEEKRFLIKKAEQQGLFFLLLFHSYAHNTLNSIVLDLQGHSPEDLLLNNSNILILFLTKFK